MIIHILQEMEAANITDQKALEKYMVINKSLIWEVTKKLGWKVP